MRPVYNDICGKKFKIVPKESSRLGLPGTREIIAIIDIDVLEHQIPINKYTNDRAREI